MLLLSSRTRDCRTARCAGASPRARASAINGRFGDREFISHCFLQRMLQRRDSVAFRCAGSQQHDKARCRLGRAPLFLIGIGIALNAAVEESIYRGIVTQSLDAALGAGRRAARRCALVEKPANNVSVKRIECSQSEPGIRCAEILKHFPVHTVPAE